MKKYTPTILAALVILLGATTVAYAQNYVPLAPLPGTVTGAEGAETTNMALYISGAIKLAIALGAGLAFLFAIIGGTKYVASSINVSAKSDALEQLQRALIGLAIILSSYLVLNSIDPKLVAFDLTLKQVTPAELEQAPIVVDTRCDITPPTTLTGKALEMENGVKVVWEAGAEAADPNTFNANLNKTKVEVDKLLAALKSAGYSGTVTSAYRPYEYQRHLYEISTKWNNNLKNLNTEIWPGCVPLQKEIESEYTKHGLLGPVANPVGNAPHIIGTGVDIDLKGIAYTEIDAFMSKKGIKLDWQNLENDEVHFNYSATGPK